MGKTTRNQGEPAQNLGRLELNDNLAGNFKTVTPLRILISSLRRNRWLPWSYPQVIRFLDPVNE